MTWTVDFSDQFTSDWKNFLPDQKAAVGGFLSTVVAHGLDPIYSVPGSIGLPCRGG